MRASNPIYKIELSRIEFVQGNIVHEKVVQETFAEETLKEKTAEYSSFKRRQETNPKTKRNK